MKASIIPPSEPAAPVQSIGALISSLRALYAYKKPATYKDLAPAADLKPATVSQSLSALKDIGFCNRAGRKGLYEVTQSGVEFIRYADSGKRTESAKILQRSILNSPHYLEIVSFLRTKKDTPRDPLDLALAVERMLRKQWSTAMRAKVGTSLKSILAFADLIEVKDGMIVSRIGIIEDPQFRGSSHQIESERVITPGSNSEHESLSIPQFTIHVKRNLRPVRYLLDMVKTGSMLHSWLMNVEKEILEDQKKTEGDSFEAKRNY